MKLFVLLSLLISQAAFAKVVIQTVKYDINGRVLGYGIETPPSDPTKGNVLFELNQGTGAIQKIMDFPGIVADFAINPQGTKAVIKYFEGLNSQNGMRIMFIDIKEKSISSVPVPD